MKRHATAKLCWSVASVLSLVCAWQQATAAPMPPDLTFVCIYSRIEDGSVECYDTMFAIASVTDCNTNITPLTADSGGPGTMVITFDGVGEAIIFAYQERSWQSGTPGTGQVTLNVFSGIPPWDTPRRCPTYTHP